MDWQSGCAQHGLFEVVSVLARALQVEAISPPPKPLSPNPLSPNPFLSCGQALAAER
jgi:hypothetical protein